MGGSSGGQVTGYRYFTNLLLFIGNPIENLLAINFDKRGWISGDRASDGDNGELIGIKAQNLYGENEGGVYGVINLHTGTNAQLPDAKYSQYMSSKGLQASAYPYQSYLSFSGSGKANTGNSLIDGVFGVLAGYMNDAFYVGNSGYMKEMLLWVKRIHVKNDGDVQWYDAKSEVPSYDIPIKHFEAVALRDIQDESGVMLEKNSNYGNSNTPAGSEVITFNLSGPAGIFDFRVTFGFFREYGFIEVLDDDDVDYSYRIYDGGAGSAQHILEVYAKPGQQEFSVRVGWGEPNGQTWAFGFIYQDIRSEELNVGVDSGDMNPIHKIREILTDDTAMNKPESSVNNDNFIKAADRIYDEGLGISWSITEKSCIDAINELCYHIEAGIRVNRQTGLYEMVLFRDDWFKEDEIHTISESKIKSMQYEITNADEVINQVNVNFYDRANIKSSSFSISESGLIQTLSRVNAETVDFPYFMNMRNAEIVANWKLRILSTGVIKGSFTTGWREARKWNRYDLIRLPWSKRWTGTILVRIMNINLGGPTNNEVTIEYIEVVPATGMMNTTIVIDDPIDTKPEAPQPCNAKVFELPYFEAVRAFGEREVNTELADNPEAGYLCAIAEKPQNNSLNAALYVDSGNSFERMATINYCETSYLDQAIDRIRSAFVVKNVGNIESVRIGSQIFINDETMVYQSYDNETKVLTVKRGAFGVPQNHTEDSILYFADDFIAVDQTIYVQSEVVSAKVLTTTPSGVLDLADAEAHEVEFISRAIRPYPPANVKINGEYWPSYIEDDLLISWSDRNRLQQTGGQIIGYFEPSVTLEPNTQTLLTIVELDMDNVELATHSVNVTASSSYILLESAMQAATHSLHINLRTVRDGYECINAFDYTVIRSTLIVPTNVTFEVIEY